MVESMNQVVKAAAECGLSETHPLVLAFMPFFEQAMPLVQEASTINVTSCDQLTEMERSKEIRLALRPIRTAADKLREEKKSGLLKDAKDIEAVSQAIIKSIKAEENRLEEQEKFAINAEKTRKTSVAASRRTLLGPYAVDTTHVDLGSMKDDVFARMLDDAKLAHEARVERERKAKADAETAEAERRRVEAEKNAELERLRLETVAKDKAAAEERRVAADAAKDAKDKADAEARSAAEVARKEREAAEAKAAEERRAREAAEKVIRDTESAKKKAEAEAEKARIKAERAPDADKIRAIAAAIRAIPMPTVSASSRSHLLAVRNQLSEWADWVDMQSQDLEGK